MVGKTISHYEILEKLGAGGMGDIYKAHDNKLNRTVAIKVLAVANSEGTGRRRFIQEAQAASALNHPNIITIHDIVSQDDNEFMVMEYVAGKTLADVIPPEGMTIRNTLRCAVQIADALQAAHAAGIIHRDLKPGNVMVTDAGRVKVLDFGLAKFTGRDSGVGLDDATVTNVDAAPLTVKGSIIGTVSYMSPEQAQGKTVDQRTDIFSFGVVLYEMVTGQRAFQADSAITTITAILRDEARPIAEIAKDVPAELEQIIGRALRKNPDDRWQSMAEVQAALENLKQRSDSGTLTMTPPPPSAPRPAIPAKAAAKKPPMTAMVAAAAALVLAAAGGGIWWKKHHARMAPVSQALPAPAPQAIAEAPAVASPVPAATADQAAADAVLTNQNILDMVDAKISNALIINQIRSSKTKFNLSVPEVIRLSKAGVPDAVIEAMRNPTRLSAGGTPRPAPPVQPQPQNTAPAQNAAPAQPAAAPQPAPVQAPPPPAAEPVVPAAHPVEVADGLPFIIRLMEDVPNSPQAGQTLHFQATKDFRVGNIVVVAQGAAVTGEIIDAGKKKLLSKGPKPTFRLVQATAVDGSKLNLRATPAHHPDGKSDRSLDVPGHASPKEVAAAAGTEYIAYTEGAQTVSVKQ